MVNDQKEWRDQLHEGNSLFPYMFYFDIFSDLRKSCKNITKDSPMLFTQILKKIKI